MMTKTKYLLAGIAILFTLYSGTALYFSRHFFPHTKVEDWDLSFLNLAQSENLLNEQLEDFEFQVIQDVRDKETEKLYGKDFQLVYGDRSVLRDYLKKQKAWLWPWECLRRDREEIPFTVKYNREQLAEKVSQLPMCNISEKIISQNAHPYYEGNSFSIKPEVIGNELIPEKLLEHIENNIQERNQEIHVSKEFYKMPRYLSDSPEVTDACKLLNEYCNTEITYDAGDQTETVSRDTIAKWLKCSKNMKVRVNKDKIKKYVKDLAEKYDTCGKTREFTSRSGETVQVSGGTYGWILDQDLIFQQLYSHIKKKESFNAELPCVQSAKAHASADWGTTYLEVSISLQHMWYVEDGQVILDTPVVTGKPVPKTETPTGVYDIMGKLRHTVLIGDILPSTGEPEYKSPVEYWMRVTDTGIGFHDADWQTQFGKDVYTRSGSHGCINMPVQAIQAIFDRVETGTPVIIW